MFKKILIPTDGTELSEQAAGAAIELARCYGSQIVVLSVAEPYPLVPAALEGAMAIDPGIDSRALQDMVEDRVRTIAVAAAKLGIPCETTTAISFSPHEEIIRVANEHQCDVIFMASHGRRGLTRLLTGSVTQKVLAYAEEVAVLVFRPPRPEPTSADADTKDNAPARVA